MARKKEKPVSKIKSRGLKKLKLGGGENAKADYDSMIDDGYHAMDDNGAAKRAMNNLKGTGLNPMSPGDVKNALRERVSEPEFDKESTRSPMKNYSEPLKYKTMTPMATDGGGFKMSMGSKENFSDSNFSNKDKGTMSAAPSIMKDDWGGETIEMKDQGSPLNYGVRDNVKKERKMTGAENTQAGKDKRSEQKRQYLKDAMAVVQTGASVAGAVAGSDRRLKNDIKLIGLSPSGLKIYNFNYKDIKFGKGTFQGVMSDEIPQSAIVKHEDGFDRVDYSKLDVEFKAV